MLSILKLRLKERKTLFSVSLLLAVICIYAPFEIYLTNINEFWFGLSLFWWLPTVVGIGVMVISTFIGVLLNNKSSYIYVTIVFVVSICLYIQGNFLNLRINVLNGSQIEWVEYKRQFIFNCAILLMIAIILIVLLRRKKLEKYVMYCAIFLSAIQMISLLVLLIPHIDNDDEKVRYTRVVTDKGVYEVGSDSNIIVFILDMFDDAYFKQILDSEPEIKEKFDGFTYFSNFTGSYSTTNYSMALLATGKHFYNNGSWQDWLQSVSNDRLYLDELLDDGYELSVYSDFIGYFPSRFSDVSDNYIDVPLKIGNKTSFICDLYRLTAIKYLPDILKPYLWMTGTEFEKYKSIDSEYNSYTTENLMFKERLEKSEIAEEGNDKQIKFIHITGTHYPYLIDENALEVDADSVSAVQCARGVLHIVGEYLDQLKRCGSYDKSNIILMADHGYYWDGVLTNPVFLVKPQNASGALVINGVPASQTDFAPTVLQLADLDKNHDYGESVFDIDKNNQRERLFYQYYLQEHDGGGVKWRLVEYRIPFESNDPDGFELTDVEYTVNGSKIEHSKYCKTCKYGVTNCDEIEGHIRVVHEKDTGYPE